MNARRMLAGLALSALVLATANSAFADTVTFDDAVGTGLVGTYLTPGLSFSVQGLTFTNNGPGDAGSNYLGIANASPNGNGTNDLVFNYGQFNTMTITLDGGGAFNLSSIDFANSDFSSDPVSEIFINGNALAISNTMTTYALNLSGVTQVTISGSSDSTFGYWVADNVTYSAVAVPEPSTWALMIGGFGLAGAALRRRQASIAA